MEWPGLPDAEGEAHKGCRHQPDVSQGGGGGPFERHANVPESYGDETAHREGSESEQL